MLHGMNSLNQLTHAAQTAHRMTLGLLDGLRPENWLHRPVPGGQHAA